MIGIWYIEELIKEIKVATIWKKIGMNFYFHGIEVPDSDLF